MRATEPKNAEKPGRTPCPGVGVSIEVEYAVLHLNWLDQRRQIDDTHLVAVLCEADPSGTLERLFTWYVERKRPTSPEALAAGPLGQAVRKVGPSGARRVGERPTRQGGSGITPDCGKATRSPHQPGCPVTRQTSPGATVPANTS